MSYSKDEIYVVEDGVRFSLTEIDEIFNKIFAGRTDVIGRRADLVVDKAALKSTCATPAGASSDSDHDDGGSKPDPRDVETWVQCCKEDCQKWRKLRNVTDVDKLPDYWTCDMNADPKFNRCKIPSEVDGSELDRWEIVWARSRQKWWPALVDTCPDYKTHVWNIDGSIKPSEYHVVFFSEPVSRAWIKARFILKYSPVDEPPNVPKDSVKFVQAVKAANAAFGLSKAGRGQAYSFAKRYKGAKTKKKSMK